MTTFPIITKNLQEAYEQGTKGSPDKTPEICGYYGRACRQMDRGEGANRALCMDCGLANYCKPANAGRMSMVYDGQIAGDLTKNDLIKAILREYDVIFEENTIRAMEEAFRNGFLRGEDYGRQTAK